MNRSKSLRLAIMVMLLLVAAPLLTDTSACGASVSISVRVGPAVATQVVDGGLLIRSNAPWRLDARGSRSDGTPVHTSTSSSEMPSKRGFVPVENLTAYTIVLEPH